MFGERKKLGTWYIRGLREWDIGDLWFGVFWNWDIGVKGDLGIGGLGGLVD